MATEPTEEHGINNLALTLFPCFSVDSVAKVLMGQFVHVSVIIKL